MTTESDKKMDINKLLDKPYSELTDDEINAVIEWKSDVKARDAQFQQLVDTIKQQGEEQLKAMREQAARDAKRQDDLLQASLDRLKRAGGDAN